jgi:hypothetical protein
MTLYEINGLVFESMTEAVLAQEELQLSGEITLITEASC